MTALGTHPRSGVAEAFTYIFPPAPRSKGRIAPAQRDFQMLRRPSQLTPNARLHFAPYQCLERPPLRIPQPQPGKMKQLMDQDPCQLSRLSFQLRIQHDPSPPLEACRVDFLPA